MPSDATLVFYLMGVAAIMMASNRVRYDLIALFVLVTLALSGILTPSEAVAGFGATIIIMVAGLFVVGEMLDRTGVARTVGDGILKFGRGQEVRLMIPLSVGAAILGSVMSSTAVVAIFIPIVMRIARDSGINAARLLLPMSFGALISGMLTLIGTPGNLAVSDALREATGQPLGFFSFSLVGALVLLGTVVFFVFVGRHMLGPLTADGTGLARRRDRSFAELYRSHGFEGVEVLRVTRDMRGEALGSLLAQAPRVLSRWRRGPGAGAQTALYNAGMELREGDLIVVTGDVAEIAAFARTPGLGHFRSFYEDMNRWIDTLGIMEVMIHPEAAIRGRTLADLGFRDRYGLEVLDLLRDATPMQEVQTVPLRGSDRLLVAGPWPKLDAINATGRDFVILEEPAERAQSVPNSHKLWIALIILLTMIAVSIGGLSITIAVILAAIAAVLTGTISTNQAYRSIRLETLVLIAGMLPLSTALDKTGGADMIVQGLLQLAGDDSPRAVLFALFALTMSLSWILSNTATLVLVAPIAVNAALSMGVSPLPMAIAVLIAGSAGFASPVSSPVVTLVVSPGGYKFVDFLKIGLPLTALVAAIVTFVVPALFPF
ncbi:putative transport protein [Roseibacterium elongatum DSM 19469]|uniref:Putative transport protein n=1 Tax=Roseicyclus elongatus DSM 19469 TaxID=1294273 RepID=W8RY47_9RHOB|nr:SLC13 family permease [Roseibacterium elongatum]AHM02772.1 putative transport protein [Roseibacterium elongatum DSM 19469]